MKKKYLAIAACLALFGMSAGGGEAKADSFTVSYTVSSHGPSYTAQRVAWVPAPPVKVVSRPYCPPHAAYGRKVYYKPVYRHAPPPHFVRQVRHVPHRHHHHHR